MNNLFTLRLTSSTIKRLNSTESDNNNSNYKKHHHESKQTPKKYIRGNLSSNKEIKNSSDLDNVLNTYEKLLTAENVNRKKRLEIDDNFDIEEKKNSLENNNIVKKKYKIPPTYEEYQMILALNNSINETNNISKRINNLDYLNLQKSQNNNIYQSIDEKNSKIKRDINYEKISKTNLNSTRSKTPNTQINRKQNFINEGKITKEKSDKDSKNNILRDKKIQMQDILNSEIYLNSLPNSNEKKIIDRKVIKNVKPNYNDSIESLEKIREINHTPIKIDYSNINPNYKNIYKPQIYNQINHDQGSKKENLRMINNNMILDKKNIPIRAISARPAVGSSNQALSSQNNSKSNPINCILGKNYNSNPLSSNIKEREIEKNINKMLDPRNSNIIKDNMTKNQSNLLYNNNLQIRAVSSRDRVLYMPSNYNILSKNNNQNKYLNNPILNNNNQSKNNNIIKKEILNNLNDKFNIITPKLGDNNKKIGNVLLGNDFLSKNNEKEKGHFDRNLYLNLKINSSNKPVNILQMRK